MTLEFKLPKNATPEQYAANMTASDSYFFQRWYNTKKYIKAWDTRGLYYSWLQCNGSGKKCALKMALVRGDGKVLSDITSEPCQKILPYQGFVDGKGNFRGVTTDGTLFK